MILNVQKYHITADLQNVIYQTCFVLSLNKYPYIHGYVQQLLSTEGTTSMCTQFCDIEVMTVTAS